MDAVVAEARITLDARLFGQNVVVLSLEIADNLAEADECELQTEKVRRWKGATYLASLSIWSPKPGVSTMVREMRVPSSSSSNSVADSQHVYFEELAVETPIELTNCDGLYPDALFNVRIGGIVGVLAGQDVLAAEGVDKCCSACEETGQDWRRRGSS